MPTTDVDTRETEHERVVRWRAERLERAGFTSEQARELAGSPEVDIHRAVALLEQGCSPETAAQILL